MLTAGELEEIARTVLTTRGNTVNRVDLGDGVHKAYGDDVVLLWFIVRSFQNQVIDEIQVERTPGPGMPKYGRQNRVLVVRNGRVAFYDPDPRVEEHLIRLTLLDMLARQAT